MKSFSILNKIFNVEKETGKLSIEEVNDLREAFALFDIDGDGVITTSGKDQHTCPRLFEIDDIL